MDRPMSGGYYVVKTLGCKANFYDSQLIEAELQKRGWNPLLREVSAEEAGDASLLCLVNSCTVTDEADRQSRKMAARLARENPNAFVVVTGCAAEVDPERLTASRGIHYVIGNRDKPQLVDLILSKVKTNREAGLLPSDVSSEVLGRAQGYEEILSRHPMDREWPGGGESFLAPPTHLEGHTGKTRAFLKIQEGCNSFCTYCIIPYGRGPSRSLRPREVISQVRKLVSEGVVEVVITGTNIGDYGTDWEVAAQHGELFRMILEETELPRLRVSSLDPTEITDEILALMEREPRFCPHFHVSLQSPHSRILKLMKRRYGFEELKERLGAIARLPAPLGGVFVGMDLITGFPGETEEEFKWGYQALQELPWSRLHVFPYSERAGTPATRLSGAVRQEERLRRARILNELSLERMRTKHQSVLEACLGRGLPLEGVLLERAGKAPAGLSEALSQGGAAHSRFSGIENWQGGYTPNYLRVMVPERKGLRNEQVAVLPHLLTVDPQNGDVVLIGDIVNP